MEFEIKKRDAAGRVGKLSTDHGSITTPTLLPVINPNKMIITPKEMKKHFGTQMVITNSYIIKKSDYLQSIALREGVHHLIDFDGPIMTDSGTFQSYIYGDVDVDPLEIVRFQRDIGSDIGTILDIFGTPDQDEIEAENGLLETIRRAKDSISEKGKMNLACPVQGGIYPRLRLQCAQELAGLDADVFPIGGVVPLMEDQRYVDLIRVILASKQGLPSGKPVHLFGAGHPLVFAFAVALGCDLFDSSSYIKYAQQDRLIFPWGTKKLKDITELACPCPICSSYSANELKKCEKQKRMRILAMHNLFVSFAEMKRIRDAVAEGSLWELVEQKACLHPTLFDAVKILRSNGHKKWLEKAEPIHKAKAFFYTGDHSIHRPLIYRLHKRLIAYYNDSPENIIILPETERPYQLSYAIQLKHLLQDYDLDKNDIVIDSPFGPVPIWLDEMYPVAQSVFPSDVDMETKTFVSNTFEHIFKKKKKVRWKLQDEREINDFSLNQDEKEILDRKRVESVALMQFGKHAAEALFQSKITCKKSKKTGKIRTVFSNDDHIVSMRASDGLFTLKKAGAVRIHQQCAAPLMRVVIDDDAVPFVKDGKSVFAKFVKKCDVNLRPYDECLIVDDQDTLIAVGRCLLNRDEMMSFSFGIAVKNRESCDAS